MSIWRGSYKRLVVVMGETEEEKLQRLIEEYEANKRFAAKTNREYNIWESNMSKMEKKKRKRGK